MQLAVTTLVYDFTACARPGAWATCATASSAAITWRKHGKQAVKVMQLVCRYACPAVTTAFKAKQNWFSQQVILTLSRPQI